MDPLDLQMMEMGQVGRGHRADDSQKSQFLAISYLPWGQERGLTSRQKLDTYFGKRKTAPGCKGKVHQEETWQSELRSTPRTSGLI